MQKICVFYLMLLYSVLIKQLSDFFHGLIINRYFKELYIFK